MIFQKSEMLSMAIEASQGHVEPALTCAVIHSLSQWMPATVNYAPTDMIAGMEEDELNGQQSTYGLMQFTGQQARQAGYKGFFLGLIEVPINLKIGVQLLKEAIGRTSRLESGLIVYLGRSRTSMVPGILLMIQPYEKLISERPVVNR